MKFLSFFLLIPISIFAQSEYPKDYFRAPLDIPIELSGCFGELRANHFHSGFDIKTQKQEGLKVFAVADGYVSRIKISTYGYGKAIYITHPNGFTSLYGHLSRANGAVEKYIKDNQYKEKAYEIEVFLKPNELPVKKGDLVAFSGNTGGSGGPHLHFEFRDSKTEKILNPMLFGFDKFFKDTKKPTLNGMILYPIDENSVVNQSNTPVSASLTLQKDGTYLSEKVKATGNLGFGINTFDTFDNSYNKYGIYKTEVFNNGKSIFGYEFNAFAFEEFRYINALLDYPRLMKMNQRVQRLFMKTPFPLSIIKTDEKNGIININKSSLSQIYRIEISDFFNNKTIITVPVEFSGNPATNIQKIIPSKYFVKAKTENNFAKDNAEVFFPAGTFYDDFYMDFDVKGDTVVIHNESVPAHTNFTITIDDKKNYEGELNKMFIAKIEKKKLEYIPTKRNGVTFTGKTRELGSYILAIDKTPPKLAITKPIEGKWITDQKNIQFTISDDLSGIDSYNAYLNGTWILLEYEYKNKKLTHSFDDNIVAEGKNDLKLVVTDNVGNSTIFETSFFRSQK
jgi:murein DD-endopeptidase MepM/ murein hydrolase activator NlpD